MPGLKDLLKKKDKIAQNDHAVEPSTLAVPEFKIIRSTTESEEVIQPPSDPEDNSRPFPLKSPKSREKSKERRHLAFRKSSNADVTRDPTAQQSLPVRPKDDRRFSGKLHFHRPSQSRSASTDSSVILPQDLPDAPTAVGPTGPDGGSKEEQRELNQQREAAWEKRATILAQSNPLLEQEAQRQAFEQEQLAEKERKRARSRSPSISDKRGDDDIQEAIRLHELGELKLSTAMFGRLASPAGANNALAQVLYGLALRHGWGIDVDAERAIHYLSLAASNSASVERLALESGMRKGGAAKGELVLAIFELANCFRHGWGVKKDAAAARQYYETAANLGDTDAMEEAAWCLVEGFGGGKDKFKAAQYLRLAEEKGHKTVGNSWIWKDKYSPK